MLTLKVLESKFQNLNPFGTITKQTNNKYWVCFDSRDSRTDAQRELDAWGVSADNRKFYTYYASNLKELAYKLKIELPETDTQLSKVNQEWEAMLSNNVNADELAFELFGE